MGRDLPGSAAPFRHRMANVEVIPHPSRVHALYDGRNIPHGRADVGRMVVKACLEAMPRPELRQAAKITPGPFELFSHVHERVLVIARLEERDSVFSRGREDRARCGMRRRNQLGRDHRDFKTLVTDGGHRSGQVFRAFFRHNMPARAHGKVDTLKAHAFDAPRQFAPRRVRKVLGKKAHAPLESSAGTWIVFGVR